MNSSIDMSLGFASLRLAGVCKNWFVIGLSVGFGRRLIGCFGPKDL